MSVEFIYEPEFPREDVSVDIKKVSALNIVAQEFSQYFIGFKKEFDDNFIESLQLLGIDSMDVALEFDGVLMKIESAIREIEDLATRLALWRKKRIVGERCLSFQITA